MYLLLTILLGWPFSDDEIKQEIQAIHNEAKSHYKTNIDSTIYLLQQAHTRSQESNYAYGEAKSLYLLGDMADRQNKPSKATTQYLNALRRYADLADEKSLSDQAKICTTLGKIYQEHYKLSEAVEFYDKGLEYAMSSDDEKTLFKILHNKSIVYRKVGDLDKAKELMTLKLKELPEDYQQQKLLTYNQLGLVHKDLELYDLSLFYYKKVLEMDVNGGASLHRGQAYHNIGSIYLLENNPKNAWGYFEKALMELMPLGSPKDLFATYQDMAELALHEGHPRQALSYAEKATALLENLPKTPDYYGHYYLLAKCMKDINPKLAFDYSDRFYSKNTVFIDLQNELIAQGKSYKMDLITTTYLNAIKEHEQQIKFYWTLFTGFIFLLVAGYFSIRLVKIYRYKSPETALNLIKNPNELLYLLDLFRNEKEELKRTRRQEK